jgi:exodeoxyribonuclease-3
MKEQVRMISWNVNGIRAVEKKGEMSRFLERYQPDIFLIQEVKAVPGQLSQELTRHPEYWQFYHPARKAGYAGTAVWVKKNRFPEAEFYTGMPAFDDDEGRVSQVKIGSNRIFGVYFPNGGKSDQAWQGKLAFYEDFLAYINSLRAAGDNVIFAGDVNCCHEAIDIARPKENDGKIGYHPEERKRISIWIENGWVDVWRQTYPDKGDVYSWWSFRSGARSRNVGWRLDYFFVDQTFFPRVRSISYLGEQMGSDHCPVMMEVDGLKE